MMVIYKKRGLHWKCRPLAFMNNKKNMTIAKLQAYSPCRFISHIELTFKQHQKLIVLQ